MWRQSFAPNWIRAFDKLVFLMKIQFWSSPVFEWLCISVHFKHQSNKGRKLRPATRLVHARSLARTHALTSTRTLPLMHAHAYGLSRTHTCSPFGKCSLTYSQAQSHTQTHAHAHTHKRTHATHILAQNKHPTASPHSEAVVCIFATSVCNFCWPELLLLLLQPW